MIDSAQAYNEEHVGIALKESGIPREDVFLVSKVHPRFLGYEETLKSVEDSLKKLQVQTLTPRGMGEGGSRGYSNVKLMGLVVGYFELDP